MESFEHKKNTNFSVSVPFVAGVGPEPTTSGL